MIHHVYTAYAPSDPDTARRQRIAQATWPRQPWKECPVADADLPRLWQEKGRSFPYLRDLFDAGCQGCRDEDILVYTNADIMVRSDCCAKIAEALQTVDACYCYRRDFHHRVESPIPDADYAKGLDYAGSDLKAFRVIWWRAYREDMPDMLIGNEAYDPVLRQLIDETNGAENGTRIRDVICHERHGSYWENPKHRYTLKSQLHNLGLAKAFFVARGIDPRRFGIP
ncbi:MAG: hypothetical protein JWR69_2334 [Pedosphaera sp.]|nr:hypothetical protein [Pedosphaera sp.]